MSSVEETIDPGERVRLLKRDEYQKLVELGAFEDENVEFLYGRIVEMPPQGVPHDAAIVVLNRVLVLRLEGRALVRPQCSFLGPESVPIPDLAVVPIGDQHAQHPNQAFLVIEVSRTTLRKDRGIKARLYAECRVPEYWIVDVNKEVIEVRTEPADDHYERTQTYRRGDRIRLGAFTDVEITVDDVFG